MAVRLARIDVFPIKSLDGVCVPAARVLPAGCLENDRRYSLVDAAGKSVNGKRTPLAHRLKTSFDPEIEHVTIQVRDAEKDAKKLETFSLSQDRRCLESYLSECLGLAVTVQENAEAGFPDDTDAPGPTVIGLETLGEVAKWFALDHENARRRFRANLAVEGGGPFWEDHLFGAPGDTVTFRIGEMFFFGTNPCARCVVPSRDPDSGEQTQGFAKMFADLRRQTLLKWAENDAFDHFYRFAVNTRPFSPAGGAVIRVGDVVELVNG